MEKVIEISQATWRSNTVENKKERVLKGRFLLDYQEN